jgi:hypothetical protein
MRKLAKDEEPPKRSHQWVDMRDLEMAQMIAKKIRKKPALFREAVKTLQHWKRILRPIPEAVLEWDRIFLTHKRDEILDVFTEDSENGQRLRQSDPFCGVLTEEERADFLTKYEEA